MDYSKLHWECDYLSTEIYGEYIDEFAVGVYRLRDYPEITVYINTETGEIIDVFLDADDDDELPIRFEGSD